MTRFYFHPYRSLFLWVNELWLLAGIKGQDFERQESLVPAIDPISRLGKTVQPSRYMDTIGQSKAKTCSSWRPPYSMQRSWALKCSGASSSVILPIAFSPVSWPSAEPSPATLFCLPFLDGAELATYHSVTVGLPTAKSFLSPKLTSPLIPLRMFAVVSWRHFSCGVFKGTR